MSTDFLILHSGIIAFHRFYGEKKFENFDLTAGFFQAILEFSKIEVGESLETINMSDSLFYFYAKEGLTFILRQERTSSRSREEDTHILVQLATKFFEEFPSAAAKWDGNTNAFNKFTASCDKIFQSQPKRKGFPILLRVALEPFFIAPVLLGNPVTEDFEISLYELQFHLKKYIEQMGRVSLIRLKLKPILLYLSNTKQIAYIYAFPMKMQGSAATHFLCYVAKESEWFAFYQVMSLFFKRAQQILPKISQHLIFLESSPPLSDFNFNQRKTEIQDCINDWADLNQYLSTMQVLLSTEFFKSSISQEDLTDAQSLSHFTRLLDCVGKDFDKVLNANLGLRQVLFTSKDPEKVKQALSAFLAWYPHPSVTLWTESASDSSFIGTRPELAKNYDPSIVIVDLDQNEIVGGTKNEFCAKLLRETQQFLKIMSVRDSRIYFLERISGFFALFKNLLKALAMDEAHQEEYFQGAVKENSLDSVQLTIEIGENLNPLLAQTVQKFVQKMINVVRACHKCKVYIKTGLKFNNQNVLLAFEGDHKRHPVRNADAAEVTEYTNVGEMYASRLAQQAGIVRK